MKLATFTLVGITPMSQSHVIMSVKKNNERDDQFEERTWMERAHINGGETVYIPAMALKSALASAAKYRAEKIPGKGNKQYAKVFGAGILVLDHLDTGVHKKDIRGDRVFVNPQGQRGGGRRVWKTFPTIDKWEAKAKVYIADESITEEVFLRHLDTAVNLIGFGMHRPENGGFKGRAMVKNFKWSDYKE